MRDIMQKLLGVLELHLFMRRGVDRFTASLRDMALSFIIPALLFPVAMAGVFMANRPEIAGLTATEIVMLYTVRKLFIMALSLYLFYAVGKALNRHEEFIRFITISNWSDIGGLAVGLPVYVSLALHQEWMSTYGLFTVVSFYSLAVFGYTVTRAFRLSWEMGVVAAAIGLAIGQTSLQMLFYCAQRMTA